MIERKLSSLLLFHYSKARNSTNNYLELQMTEEISMRSVKLFY